MELPHDIIEAGRRAANAGLEGIPPNFFLNRALQKLGISEEALSSLAITEKAALIEFIAGSIVKTGG